MEINSALNWATKKLNKTKINSASLDAELLLSYALKQPKEFLYAQPDFLLKSDVFKKFKKLINKRLKHIPIAHLTGKKEFYGYKFKVNKHVLVPRPESEKIIDLALQKIKKIPISDYKLPITIVDIGTGSGCLIISLANELKKQNLIEQFELHATDVSKKALMVAERNAKLHQVDDYITFFKGKLLQPVKGLQIDLIITNLPYLTKRDVKREPSIKKEPKKALIGTYTKFFKQLDTLSTKPTVIYENKSGINLK